MLGIFAVQEDHGSHVDIPSCESPLT
jgi:hypothetical protein